MDKKFNINDHFGEDLTAAAKAFSGSPAESYLVSRGISTDTAQKFGLGYIPAIPKRHDADTLVIPTADGYYVERKLDVDCDKKERYTNASGQSHMFNAKVLYTARTPIYVVEGAIDALSIMECQGEALSLNSTIHVQQFLSTIEKNPPCQNLIVAMDDDAAGKTAASKLADGLSKLKLPFIVLSGWEGCNDANELLVKDRSAFERFISKTTAEAVKATIPLDSKDKELLEWLLSNRMDNCVDAMLSQIAENATKPRLSTGFKKLDEALDGGIAAGLHLVAAMSSLGKTTLVIQMVTNLAKQGQDVLFFSLEMSKLELYAKCVSRYTYELDRANSRILGQSTSQILHGDYINTEKDGIKKHMQAAISEYRKHSGKLTVIESFCEICADQVKDVTESYIRLVGKKPLVVIDYVQLLQPKDPRWTDKQNMDYAIKVLKYLVALGIPVIAISSLNRQSYDSPVRLGSLKETGNLEYSAEVVMALDFEAMYQAIRSNSPKSFDLEAEKEKVERDVLLTILKNRNGQTGQQIRMSFNPRFNYFEEKSENTRKRC